MTPPIALASQKGERSEETDTSVRDKGPFAGLHNPSPIEHSDSAIALGFGRGESHGLEQWPG